MDNEARSMDKFIYQDQVLVPLTNSEAKELIECGDNYTKLFSEDLYRQLAATPRMSPPP